MPRAVKFHHERESGGGESWRLIISRLDSINAYIANIQKREVTAQSGWENMKEFR